MSVFLRWGVFGILGVAALMYAYNASKRLADARGSRSAPVVTPGPERVAERELPSQDGSASGPDIATEDPLAPPEPSTESARAVSPRCELEITVAQRALQMRKEGAPLDRVLRMPEIAWEESAEQRQRLEAVATRWFGYESDFRPESLRIAVLNNCRQAESPP